MTTKIQILSFLAENRRFLKENYHIVKIGLFGSFAREEQEVGSDIDFVVEFENNTQNLFELKQNLRAYLKAEFQTEVDICREKYIKPKLRKSILKETIYA